LDEKKLPDCISKYAREQVRGSMTVAQSIVQDYLHKLREFYPDDEKSYYQQRRLLIQAMRYPARWLDKRGVFLPAPDYRSILDTIISGIKKHGKTSTVRYFGSYFLDCVQRHIKHHEEQYYDHAKGLQAKASLAMRDIINGVQLADSHDSSSTDQLAALHSQVKSPGRRPKKAASRLATQIPLFRE
jgi:hypothetical protein